MGTNVQGHRIRYAGLLRRGALVGVLSAIVMAVIAMSLAPLVSGNTDLFSFPKVVSTIILGDGAASPLTGFEAGPVIIGLLLHLAIGAVVGTIFAFLVGLFDIEETTPIMVAGLVYGAMVFITSYSVIGRTFFPAFEHLPVIVAFWSHVAFGLIAGAVLSSWQVKFDHDEGEAAVKRTRRMPFDAESVAFLMVASLVLLAVVATALAIDPIVTMVVAGIMIAIFVGGVLYAHRQHRDEHGAASR